MTCEYCQAPASDGMALCGVCGRALRELLSETIPWCLGALDEAEVGQTAFGPTTPVIDDDRVDESPVPFRDSARRCQDQIAEILLAFKARLIDRSVVYDPHYPVGLVAVPLTLVGPIRANEVRSALHGYVPTPAELSRWMAYRFVEVMQTEGAGGFMANLDRLRKRAMKIVDAPTAPAYRGPCPTDTGEVDEDGDPINCGASLYTRRGAEEVTCVKCEQTYAVADIESALLTTVDDYRWTATELLRLMATLGEPLGKSTLYRWVNQRKLQPCGYDHDGRIVQSRVADSDKPVYELADVRRLRAESEKK